MKTEFHKIQNRCLQAKKGAYLQQVNYKNPSDIKGSLINDYGITFVTAD